MKTYSFQRIGEYKDSQQAKTLAHRDYKDATDLIIGGGTEQVETVVRRLTPTECERLQMFPDGWTDIGEWIDERGKTRQTTDSARYKALGNSIALPF